MTELDKIAYAKKFLESLADGINPLDGEFVCDDELIAHPRIVGCFRYVSQILDRVIESGGIPAKKRVKPINDFVMTDEMAESFQFSHLPVSISDIIRSLAFENRHYFYRVFFDKTGMTPQEYRQQNRN